MLAKTPINTRFYNWVVSQPKNLRYNYRFCDECSCGRFMIEELGKPRRDVIDNHPDLLFARAQVVADLEIIELWKTFDAISAGTDHTDWTFGRLARRIREQLPEVVAL